MCQPSSSAWRSQGEAHAGVKPARRAQSTRTPPRLRARGGGRAPRAARVCRRCAVCQRSGGVAPEESAVLLSLERPGTTPARTRSQVHPRRRARPWRSPPRNNVCQRFPAGQQPVSPSGCRQPPHRHRPSLWFTPEFCEQICRQQQKLAGNRRRRHPEHRQRIKHRRGDYRRAPVCHLLSLRCHC